MESRSLSPQQETINASVSSNEKPLGSILSQDQPTITQTSDQTEYRLYKQRFVGLTALVILNIIGVLPGTWFGPISNEMAHDFGISLNQVNWLSNVRSCAFLPTSLFVPKIVSKYGIHRCCQIAATSSLLSAWIRYSGTVQTVSGRGAYALLMLGQLTGAVAPPIFQIIGSKYSETWFDLEGRTTATMVTAIAGPVGYGVGQLLSPMFSSTRHAILGLGIISTAVTPLAFFVKKVPPSPPTYSASKPSPSLITLLRAVVGKVDPSSDAYMTLQSRIDFIILTVVFGIFVATIDSFAVLTGEIFGPEGYSAVTSGLLGASVLLTGIVGAVFTAPLFDRVFTHHLAIAIKLLVPILAGGWLSLVWAVTPNNKAVLFTIMAVIGVTSITLLPISLELSADITRNADGSSALLWFTANLNVVPYILVQEALRAGPQASPPNHMHRGLMFTAILAMVTASFVFFVRGKQERKQIDESKTQR
ncbi:Major facilitator superfamily domain containing protein [Amanita muscaria]